MVQSKPGPGLDSADVYAPPEARVADVEPGGAYRPELLRRHRRQVLVMTAAPFLILGGGALAATISGFLAAEETPLSGVIGIAIFVLIPVGLHLFARRNWRCPDCDRYLGRNSYAKVCRKCRARLTVRRP